MAGFFENLLQDAAGAFFGSEYLRDYNHASKTFRTNSYQNAPKLKFLFHTYFDINPQAYGSAANFGLAVKTIKLPGFNFAITEMNQYNRKRIIQTKIKYDPISITFHDDGGNMIRKLWKAYYTYYYRDGANPKVVFAGSRGGLTASTVGPGGTTISPTAADYNSRTTYNPSITGNNDWGYVGESNTPPGIGSGAGLVKIPFFRNITVFGFNQHNFAAYTLVNPIISRFNHDTYSYAEASGTMEMTMDLEYETVVYNEGALDGRSPGQIITGFGDDATYDRRVSPIAKPGANGTILGQGGLVDGVGGAIEDLANGNLIGAIQKAGTTYNTFKNANLATIAKQEALTGLNNAATNTPNTNRNTLFNIPGPFGATPGPAGVAGSPPVDTSAGPGAVSNRQTAGRQV